MKIVLSDDLVFTNEEDFINFIEKDGLTVPCMVCGKEFEFDAITFENGDPFCEEHKSLGEK